MSRIIASLAFTCAAVLLVACGGTQVPAPSAASSSAATSSAAPSSAPASSGAKATSSAATSGSSAVASQRTTPGSSAASTAASSGPIAASGTNAATTASVAAGGGDARRGEYLAQIFACQDCHSARKADGMTLEPSTLMAGGEPFPGPWGMAYSANVTTFLAKTSSDADVEKAIRGQARFLYPMPTQAYNTMAAQDMQDLIAYLRTLKPVAKDVPPDKLDPKFQAPPPNQPVAFPATAPTGSGVERGRYVVTMAACGDCHTPKLQNGQPDMSRQLAGGGIPFPGPNNTTYLPPNITPDKQTGIGNWIPAQIITAIRQGKSADGHQLNPVMPYASAYQHLSDADAAAVAAYLQSIPAVANQLPPNPRWQPSQ